MSKRSFDSMDGDCSDQSPDASEVIGTPAIDEQAIDEQTIDEQAIDEQTASSEEKALNLAKMKLTPVLRASSSPFPQLIVEECIMLARSQLELKAYGIYLRGFKRQGKSLRFQMADAIENSTARNFSEADGEFSGKLPQLFEHAIRSQIAKWHWRPMAISDHDTLAELAYRFGVPPDACRGVRATPDGWFILADLVQLICGKDYALSCRQVRRTLETFPELASRMSQRQTFKTGGHKVYVGQIDDAFTFVQLLPHPKAQAIRDRLNESFKMASVLQRENLELKQKLQRLADASEG